MLTEDEKNNRRKFIGSSDVPKILGLTGFGGPASVWLDKVKGEAYDGNLRTTIGSMLETPAMDLAIILKGKELGFVPGLNQVNKGHHEAHQNGWAGATPDFILHKGKKRLAICEVKCCEFGPEWAGGQVPLQYRAQVLWQMYVTGIKKAYVVALLGGSDLRVIEIKYDQAVIDDMVKRVEEFRQKHLIEELPIPADYRPDYAKYLWQRYPAPKQVSSVQAEPQIEALVNGEMKMIGKPSPSGKGMMQATPGLSQQKVLRSTLDLSIKEKENKIKAYMGAIGATEIHGSNWTAKWHRSAKAQRFVLKMDGEQENDQDGD